MTTRVIVKSPMFAAPLDALLLRPMLSGMPTAPTSSSRADRQRLLHAPSHLPLIGASILSADFARLGEESQRVLDAGADLLHLDVMDGHFVPNLTMGPAVCGSLRKAMPNAFLDVHLMVTDPAAYVAPFAEAGADHLTFHIEAVPQPDELIGQIHEAGMTAGLAINPPTDAEAVLRHLEQSDMVLVMSVHPGFAGQTFMPEVLKKVRHLSGRLRPHQRLEMDGGVGPQTAGACVEHGCDLLVAASAIFSSQDYAGTIAAMRSVESSKRPNA